MRFRKERKGRRKRCWWEWIRRKNKDDTSVIPKWNPMYP